MFVIAYALLDRDVRDGAAEAPRRASVAHPRASRRAFLSRRRPDVARHGRPRRSAGDHAGQPLYAGDDRCRFRRLGVERSSRSSSCGGGARTRCSTCGSWSSCARGRSTSRSPRFSTPAASTSASMSGGPTGCWRRASCSWCCSSRTARSMPGSPRRTRSASGIWDPARDRPRHRGRGAPEAIAAAVIQPLRELLGVPRADRQHLRLRRRAKWSGWRRRGAAAPALGPGVRYSLALMGDIDALRRGEPQIIDTHSLPPGPEVDALLASGVHVYMAMPMIAGGELIGALSFGGERRAISRRAGRHRPRSGHATRDRHHPGAPLRAHQAACGGARGARAGAHVRAGGREQGARGVLLFGVARPARAAAGGGRLSRGCSRRTTAASSTRRAAALLGAVRANSAQHGAADRRSARLLAPRARAELRTQPVEMTPLVAAGRRRAAPRTRRPRIEFSSVRSAAREVDPALLQAGVDATSLSNAIKFTRDRDPARRRDRRATARTATDDAAVYYVRDNGAGFDMKYYGQAVRRVPAAAQHARSSPGPASGSPSCSASSTATAAGSGPTRSSAKARRSISRCNASRRRHTPWQLRRIDG